MMTLRNEQYQKIYEKFGNPRFLPPEISANVTAAYSDIAQTKLGPYYIEDCHYEHLEPSEGKYYRGYICIDLYNDSITVLDERNIYQEAERYKPGNGPRFTERELLIRKSIKENNYLQPEQCITSILFSEQFKVAETYDGSYQMVIGDRTFPFLDLPVNIGAGLGRERYENHMLNFSRLADQGYNLGKSDAERSQAKRKRRKGRNVVSLVRRLYNMKYPETIPTAGKASIVSICDYIPIPLLLEALYPIKEECPLQYKAWELEKMRGSRSKFELENQPQFSLKSPFANIGEFVQG